MGHIHPKGIKFWVSREKQKYNKKGILVFVLTVIFFLRYKVIMFLNDGLAKKSSLMMGHTLPGKN